MKLRNKRTGEIYDFNKKDLDEWEKINVMVTNAEEQFMEMQLSEDVIKMIKEYDFYEPRQYPFDISGKDER